MVGTFLRLSSILVAFLALDLASPKAYANATNMREFWGMCAMCHGAEGQGVVEFASPAIARLPEWYVTAQLRKFRDGVRAAHPRDVNGFRMRAMAKTLGDDALLVAVSKHVAELPAARPPHTVKGNLVKGEATFQTCQACHGQRGEGNQELNAPPLLHGSDWYMLTQLKNFKAGVRGGDPTKDPNGASMAAIAQTLDDEAMRNVVAYINALSREPAPAQQPAQP